LLLATLVGGRKGHPVEPWVEGVLEMATLKIETLVENQLRCPEECSDCSRFSSNTPVSHENHPLLIFGIAKWIVRVWCWVVAHD
jgi:hypothetical protein